MNNDIYHNIENIKRIGYGSGSFGSSGFGGQSIFLATCPTVPKYSGDTITLLATPRDGIGPYYVEFRKNGSAMLGNDPLGNPYTIPSAIEDVTITRTYILNDVDIAGALTGTIDFSVYIEDSCPTGAQSCTESCIINIGCVAPVCNFTVT